MNCLFDLKTELNKIANFMRVSSLLVGVTGFFMTLISYILLGLPPAVEICFAGFLGGFSIYSLNKLTDIEEDSINSPERLSFILGRKRMVMLAALGAYLLLVVLVLSISSKGIPILLIPIAANLVYGTKLLPGIPRLKDIPVMKNVVVAISWGLPVVLLPAVSAINISNAMIAFALYFISIKVFINTVLYDIRDVAGDQETGVRTMPVILGAERTTIVLLILNSTFLPLIPFFPEGAKLVVAGMTLYGYAYIIHFRNRRNPLMLDLFVDEEWILAVALYTLII